MTINPSSFTIDMQYIPTNVTLTLSAVDTDVIINSNAWYFGDGQTAFGQVVQHAYAQPGIYNIKHVVCDYDNAIYATTHEVTAYAAIKSAVTMSLASALTAGIPSLVSISVTSVQHPAIVELYVSGSNSTAPRMQQHAWDHLLPRWGIYHVDDLKFRNAIYSVAIPTTAITINDCIVGYYGTICVNVVDDLPGTINVVATLSRADATENSRAYAAINQTVAALQPNSATRLAITHDGIGDWQTIQYNGTLIPTIVTVYDSRVRYPHVVHDVFLQGTNSVVITSTIGDFYSTNDVYEVAQHCTSAAPYFKTLLSTCATGNNVIVSASLVVSANSVYSLTGATQPFELTSLYDRSAIRRHNESYDFSAAIKRYMPEFLVTLAPSAFDVYFPAIFGNGKGDMQRDIGSKIVERVTNFFDNHGDIDTCSISQVIDDCQSFGVNASKLPFAMPPEIRRIMDITSVNQQRLWGTKCSCNTTFGECQTCCDNGLKCTLCKQDKTLNRGEIIDTTTYVVTAGVPIIYNPNRTNIFQLLHTIPVSGNLTYAISAIDYTGLIDPLDQNYSWFHYIATPAGNVIESVINWQDCNTIADRNNASSWSTDQGTVDQIFRTHLANILQRDTSLVCAIPLVSCSNDVCS